MCIFVLGAPHFVGGAGLESWAAAKVWRKCTLETIHFIPTWGLQSLDPEWVVKIENSGMNLIDCQSVKNLIEIPNLSEATVVAFCNDRATACFSDLRDLGCRIVYCPLMCSVRESEKPGYRKAFPDLIVFQSEYQRAKMEPQLSPFGYTPDKGRLIRGGISYWDMAYRPRPRAAGQPFVVGRMARATPEKWSRDLWRIYAQIPSRRAIVMGVNDMIRAYLGTAPAWATAMEPNAIPQEPFYRMLHAYVTMNGRVDENWPAVGREAMAYGVPVVAENAFGWKEMIVHGETGFLGNTPEEIGDLAARLEADEPLRLKIARQARDHLENMLAPDALWAQWAEIL